MRKEEKSQPVKEPYRFTQIAGGVLLAFGLSVFLLLLSSFGISQGILQERDMGKITAAASVLAVFLSALFTGRGGGILHGLLVSLSFILCVLAVKFFIYQNSNISAWSVITLLAILFSGILSGFLLKGRGKRRGRGGKRSRK